jgi:predicted porin
MKKLFVVSSTICLAAASISAHAFNFDVWGVGHLSVDNADDGTDASTYLASNSSRLGFSGDHAINDRMKLLFQYESGVDLTGEGSNDGNGGASSNGQLFTRTRDAFVGVSGDFGSVLFGRLGGLNQWLYDFNLFADQVGDLGNIWGGSGLPGRVDNALYYKAPAFGDADVAVSYVPEEGVNGGDAYIVKANYARDALKLGGAFARVGTGSGTPEHKVFAITGSYNLGQFTVGGGYQDESDVGGTAGNDRDSFTLGGTYKVSDRGSAKLQYTTTDGTGNETDATQWAIGYDHALDDQTTLYVAYATTDNGANTSFTANNYGHGDAVTPAVGEDPNAISVGIVYKFKARLWEK